MTHLFVCREYPPAAYPPGGIGTYVRHVTGLLARAGEMVHVIAHRWDGAPNRREESIGGRLVLHRVALDEPLPDPRGDGSRPADRRVPLGLLASHFPAQTFAWQAALLAETLIDREGVDVIEAQEWEAPLYYLQLRRAHGLGSARRPPCVVHIHSPSERIFAANAWDTSVADYAPAAGLEAYSITSADAVLCPSRFVADEVLARYGVDPSLVSVVPYPRGDAPVIARDPQTWATGTICHVGRLEPRKGVLEWADAIAAVAADHPHARFDFVGGDTPLQVTGGASVGRAMMARVPRHVRGQIRLHGTRDRAGVLAVLETACAAVVPSRWENFPYSCIESMSTGLPVVVSPNGGMREMIVDGESGWAAPDGSGAGLAQALRRALATPADARERMGHAAAARIRQMCDNDTIVARHLELKARLVDGARRAPAATTTSPRPAVLPATAPGTVPAVRQGLGVVVACAPGSASVARCLGAIRAQVTPPLAVRVVCDEPAAALEAKQDDLDWRIVQRDGRSLESTVMGAARDLAESSPALQGVVFVDASVQVGRDCFSTCAALLAHDDRLGVVSGWLEDAAPPGGIHLPPCPTTPQVWHGAAVAPLVALRRDTLVSAPAASRLEACAAAARAGWTSVTYPGVLGAVLPDGNGGSPRRDTVRYSSMAGAVQRLHTPILQWLRTCSPADRRAFVAEGMRSPGRSLRWLAGRAMRAWRAPDVVAAGAPVPSPDRDEDRSNAEHRAH